jgi:hypothetical protein
MKTQKAKLTGSNVVVANHINTTDVAADASANIASAVPACTDVADAAIADLVAPTNINAQ